MKFNCGPTADARREAIQQWHRWFAWRPVRIDSHTCRWLEYVERQWGWAGSPCGRWPEWKYRPCDKQPPALVALGMFLVEHFGRYRS